MTNASIARARTTCSVCGGAALSRCLDVIFSRAGGLAYCTPECHEALHTAEGEGAQDVRVGAQWIRGVWTWEIDDDAPFPVIPEPWPFPYPPPLGV